MLGCSTQIAEFLNERATLSQRLDEVRSAHPETRKTHLFVAHDTVNDRDICPFVHQETVLDNSMEYVYLIEVMEYSNQLGSVDWRRRLKDNSKRAENLGEVLELVGLW